MHLNTSFSHFDDFGRRDYASMHRHCEVKHLPQHSMVIKFFYRCPNVKYGQHFKLTGSIPQLGLWNFEEGLKMKTDQILFPVWRGKLTISAQDLEALLAEQQTVMTQEEVGAATYSTLESTPNMMARNKRCTTTSILIEYKYVVVTRGNDNHEELVRWETLEGPTLNRKLFISRLVRDNLRVLDEEGKALHIDVQEEPQKKIYVRIPSQSSESNHHQLMLDDFSDICITHSLRQYERLLERNDQKVALTSANRQWSRNYTKFVEDSKISAIMPMSGAPCNNSEDSLLGGRFDLLLEKNTVTGEEKIPHLYQSSQKHLLQATQANCEEVKTFQAIPEATGYSSDSEQSSHQDDSNNREGTENQQEDPLDNEGDDDLFYERQEIDTYENRKSVGGARSVSSNPQYSLDDEAENQDKERYRINKNDHLIIASFKLPIEFKRDQKTKQWVAAEGPSLLYPTLYRFREKNLVRLAWVGWSGHFLEDLTEDEATELRELYLKKDCYPIFITKARMAIYQHYIQVQLYPIFHSLKGLNDQNDDLSYNEYWLAYQDINIQFAKEISCIRETENDLIWVNDLHLILVPSYLRSQDPEALIGFFLHSAFPNSQIIQILPQRVEILKSLLCSDLIGFHLFEYAKNFVTSCKKLLDLNYEFRRGGILGIDVDGRRYVSLRIGHVGIEKECINEVIVSQEFTKCFHRLFAKESPVYGKKLVAAVDYWHPMSGITNKLRAFYEFLLENPNIAMETIFVQYIVPMRGADDSLLKNGLFQKMKTDIEELASKINTTFRKQIMNVSFEGATKAQRCALWARADLLFITCFKDGLCLQPLEFLAVKQFLGRLHDTSIILSEFAGVSQALPGIHKVNPQDISDIKKSLEQVWAMQSSKKTEMLEQAVNYLERHSTLKWAHSFLKDLKRSREITSLSYFMGATYNPDRRRLIRGNHDFVHINDQVLGAIQKDYNSSQNRLIIIDHEGALPRSIDGDPQPSLYALKILDYLSRDKKNTVFVFSTHQKRSVHSWFSSEAASVGLAAEDGYHYRFNSHFKSEYEWQKLLEIGSVQTQQWMTPVLEMMTHYVDKTDGACIERKEMSLVFDFSDADPQFAHIIVKELGKHIDIMIANGSPIQKVVGLTYLEVKPKELKKSLLIERIMQAISFKAKVDFLLYIGEDSSNEEVFSTLNQVQKSPLSSLIFQPDNKEDQNIYTCTVGKKPTNAKYFLNDSADLCSLLRSLVSFSQAQHQQTLANSQRKRRRHKSETVVSLLKTSSLTTPSHIGEDMEEEQSLPQKLNDGLRSSSAPNVREGHHQVYSSSTSTKNNIEIFTKKKRDQCSNKR